FQVPKMHTLTALLSTSLFVFIAADYSQEDCQPNEVFIQCGQCEGSCNNPRPVCDKICRGVRCECIAAKGYVRSKHGHCIRATECPGPSIYSEDPYSVGHNLATYTDADRDFRRPSDEMLGLHRNKKFFPANSIRAQDVNFLAGLRKQI
ncbi:hypothetical protein PRIPAC_72511, partial [Pristionchus pacificus]